MIRASLIFCMLITIFGCGGSSSTSTTEVTDEACTATSGTCYWIDSTNGADGNSGLTSTTAWVSLSNLSSKTLQPGDKILIKNGSIVNGPLTISNSGTAAKPIIVTNYGTSASSVLPIIRGSEGVYTSWTQIPSTSIYYKSFSQWTNVPGVVLENGSVLNFVAWNTNISTTSSSMGVGSFTVDPTLKIVYVKLSDLTEPQVSEIRIAKNLYGISVSGQNYIQISNLTIEEAALHGVYINRSSNITLDGLTIRNSGGSYISSSLAAGNGVEWTGTGSGNSITNSTIYQVFDSCVSPQQYESAKTLTSTTIQGNTFYKCGFNGVEISIQGSSSGGTNASTYINGVSVKNNTIYSIGSGWSGDREGSGIKIFNNDGSSTSAITNVTIEGNNIYSNTDHGIYLQSYTGTVTAQRNSIHANTKSGVFVEDSISSSSTGINLYYNLIYNNGQHGFKYNVPSGQGFTVYNNVFSKNGSTLSTDFNIYFHTASGTKIMKNNICYTTQTLCLYDNPGTIVSGSGFDYNLFYNSNASTDLILIGSTGYNSSSTVANFKSATSSHTHGIFADPLFVNLSADNYKLQNSSPALNAGTSVGLSTDYAGSAVGVTPEVGAYESL